MVTRRIAEYVDRLPFVPGIPDEMGDKAETWGQAEKVGIYEFAHGASDEPELTGHDRVVTTPTLYLPYGCPFKPRDRCVIGSVTYEVVGHPARWKHRRRNREVADVVNLKVVEG